MTDAPLILASGSQSRQAMLRDAGVAFDVLVPNIDEGAIKAALLAENAPPRAIADALAEMKALRVSGRAPNRLVLGADQMLVCEDRLFDKAETLAGARETLAALRGRKHRLISAAVLARDGVPVWRHIAIADLWMREFSEDFLETYLAGEGEALLGSVGCYRIEALGLQLFARAEGDCFVIRGLPLLPLLEALRQQGALAA